MSFLLAPARQPWRQQAQRRAAASSPPQAPPPPAQRSRQARPSSALAPRFWPSSMAQRRLAPPRAASSPTAPTALSSPSKRALETNRSSCLHSTDSKSTYEVREGVPQKWPATKSKASILRQASRSLISP